ncbi:hypothetical protein [Methylotuvimicrobium alcaliphilum]|uniref:Lipocalin-like domain-containing protein n=1 Tax=Methylotuvimicrobium alcaliphilum (strain DSM 19304 / NCIMB 14124 / VKM B-2133 / 20Z) TaxID=1091494 RepID=G4T019_META2|nr:hypothetical protein [Methylotuvimicrobium alcaliphilum]CCE22307.1 conserved exported protein of unknown function [Methylotuvimicrobium alcaliphilum 20Z]
MKFAKLSTFTLLFFAFSVNADVQLTQADLLGTWQIDKESVDREGTKSRSLNTTWTFREDGTMEGKSQESDVHARIDTLRAVLNYSVEDGKLVKQAAPGRSRMETCTAIEKENDNMILKCRSNYFFMTKK